MSERLTSKTGIRESLRISIPGGFGMLHSEKAYRRFFEGYVEEYVPKENGKGQKIVRTYVGSYYVPERKKHKWIVTKLMYTLVLMLTTTLFILAATRDIQLAYVSTAYLLTLIPQPICVIFLLWSFVAVLNVWMAPEKMTIGEYRRGPEALKTGTKCYSFALVIAAVGELVQLFFCTADYRAAVLQCAQGLLLAALLAFLLYRTEQQRVYHEQANPNAISAKTK